MIRQLISTAIVTGSLVLLPFTAGFAQEAYFAGAELPEEQDIYPTEIQGEPERMPDGIEPPIPDETTLEWGDIADVGPVGIVANQVPHPACAMCFTVPGFEDIINPYQIYEYMETDTPQGAKIVRRNIPNPAPGYISTTDPETGEKVWYIGAEKHSGRTDEAYREGVPRSNIEMQRIHYRYIDQLGLIPGVVAHGPGGRGFFVEILPEYFEQSKHLVPLFLEEVPVEVRVGGRIYFDGTEVPSGEGREEVEEGAAIQGIEPYKFRPLPSGANIGVKKGTRNGQSIYSYATLGPHIVRKPPYVTACCKILSLTNAHVITNYLDRPGALGPVWQPSPAKSSNTTTVGSVWHKFVLKQYLRSTRYTNWTDERPDIAALETDSGLQLEPFNNPTGTEPIRRLQYESNKYVDGPSGVIVDHKDDLDEGDDLKVWGSRTSGKVAEFDEANVCIYPQFNLGFSGPLVEYKVCGASRIRSNAPGQGDSGALVTRKGTGKRHVVGVYFAYTSGTDHRYIIPADDIQAAFEYAGEPFSHYWGTKSDYRAPATN